MRCRIDIPAGSLTEVSPDGGYYLRPLMNTEADVRALAHLEEVHADHPFWGVASGFRQKSPIEKYDYARQEIKERLRVWGRDFVFGIFARNRFRDRLVGEIYAQTAFFEYEGITDGQVSSGRAAGLELGICLSRRPADAVLFGRQGLAVAATEALLKEISLEEGNMALYARVAETNVASLRYCEKCGLGHPVLLTSVNGKPCGGIYLMRGTVTDSLRTIQRNRAALSRIYFGQGANHAR